MAECEIKVQFGRNHQVTVKGDTAKQAFELAAEFDELPRKCACGSDNIRLSVRRPSNDRGEFTYYGLKCLDCKREFPLGETQKGGRLFPKWDKGWQTYEEAVAGRSDSEGINMGQRSGTPGMAHPPARRQASANLEDDEDTIPF